MVTDNDKTGKPGTEVVNKGTGEITESKRPFSDAELRNLTTLDGVRALLGDQIAQASDFGNGFAILDANGKARLVDVPLLFLHWTFNKGDMGEFVSALVVQTDKMANVVGKFVLNDGSTGIYRQLRDITTDTGMDRGLFVANGLRRSDYTFVDEDGTEKPATTFYIDMTPAA